jgi:hypothetical protein
MFAQESEHVIEERDTCLNRGRPGSIDREIDLDVSLRSLSLQIGAPNFSHWTAKIAPLFAAPKRESSEAALPGKAAGLTL